ncbi:MAG: hypothetical protein KGL39_52855 [Patescibacteria group bacterium]|nr:hypothetical protein [Patescibacteria group bacterium]
MKDALVALVGGGSFDEFYRKTLPQFTLLANHLLRRWSCPAGVEVDDVVQEMFLAVHKVLPKYDPSRGVALERYVIWNSCALAVKWIHTQRNAFRRDDKSPGRYPVNETTLLSHCDERYRSLENLLGACDAEQENEVEFQSIIKRVSRGSPKKMEVAVYLAENSMSKRKATTQLQIEARYSLVEAKTLVDEVAEEFSKLAV